MTQGNLENIGHRGSAQATAHTAMTLCPKTVTVFLDASPSGKNRAAHAAALAQRWGAHLIGVDVVFCGETMHPSHSFARGEKAVKGVFAEQRRVDVDAEAAAAQLGEYFHALCAGLDVAGEFRPVGRGQPAEEAIVNSLHSDLVVVGHPRPSGLPDDISQERILFASGVPLLIVPNAWRGETIGENVLIGWNASRQARRAVSDAMTLLVAAKTVTVLVIDPAARRRHGEEPGTDLALQLARHGAHVTVEGVTSNGSPIAEVILRYAAQCGSDLLVVGAYSHARARELLLGGATRTLLAQMPVPVLVSR